MLSALWSAKGGAGVTTTVVLMADVVRRSSRSGSALLVDLSGDVPAASGAAEPNLGLTEWLASDASSEGLARIEHPITDAMALLPLGEATDWPEERAAALVEILVHDHRPVVVDAGQITGGDTPLDRLRDSLLDIVDRSLLVTRPCYLALRRAVRCGRAPHGVILVRETGRALDRSDVEGLLSVPVVAEVDVDPAVARAVDAGLLASRAPRHASRSLRRVA